MKPTAVFLVGPGLVGSAFLRQFIPLKSGLSLAAICDSTRFLSLRDKVFPSSESFSYEEVLSALKQSGTYPDTMLSMTTEIQSASRTKKCIVVDCTASEKPTEHYMEWLSSGASIVTPNKIGLASCHTRFRDISKYIPTSQLKYEATVGAGLPLISTLHSIIRSGDSIVKIEGILSGTLSYIFNNLSSSKPFSTVVGEARNLGYTEPDPRNDLDGMDVARKVVILARTCGMYVEGTNSVSRTSLVNEKLVEIEDTEDFLRYLPEFDRDISSLMEAADKKGKVLRYVGSVDVDSGQLHAGIREYDKEHPFANIRGSGNVISIQTGVYDADSPLVIQGPGAGAEVTAQGVLIDVLGNK